MSFARNRWRWFRWGLFYAPGPSILPKGHLWCQLETRRKTKERHFFGTRIARAGRERERERERERSEGERRTDGWMGKKPTLRETMTERCDQCILGRMCKTTSVV